MLRVAHHLLCGALAIVGCTGKTERGSGSSGSDSAAVQGPAAEPPHLEAVRSASAGHLLMVVELEPAAHAVRTLVARSVDLPLPGRRGSARPEPWRVDVVGANGAVLYSTRLPDSSVVRREFVDDDGRLRGVTVQRPTTALALHLPWLDAAAAVRLLKAGERGDTELGSVVYPKVGVEAR